MGSQKTKMSEAGSPPPLQPTWVAPTAVTPDDASTTGNSTLSGLSQAAELMEGDFVVYEDTEDLSASISPESRLLVEMEL